MISVDIAGNGVPRKRRELRCKDAPPEYIRATLRADIAALPERRIRRKAYAVVNVARHYA